MNVTYIDYFIGPVCEYLVLHRVHQRLMRIRYAFINSRTSTLDIIDVITFISDDYFLNECIISINKYVTNDNYKRIIIDTYYILENKIGIIKLTYANKNI